MTRIGCTGHQALTTGTRRAIAAAIATRLSRVDGELVGVCSLAVGADQIFAHAVLAAGGGLHIIVPSSGYHRTFDDPIERGAYEALLSIAREKTVLPFEKPGEDAFLAAGHTVADNSDLLIAVWDSKPAAGLGGTADIVDYARNNGRPVEIVWPVGSRRP